MAARTFRHSVQAVLSVQRAWRTFPLRALVPNAEGVDERKPTGGYRRMASAAGKPNLDFDDYRRCYKNKSLAELIRALVLFRLCSSDLLVNNSLQILTGARLCCRGFQGSHSRERPEVTQNGIRPLLGVPLEETLGEQSRDNSEYDNNLQTIRHCITFATELEDKFPMVHLKLTALLPAEICWTLSKLYPTATQSPAFVEVLAGVLHGRQQLRVDGLSDEDTKVLNDGLVRITSMCKLAEEVGVIIMVDAEYTYLNPALNAMSLAMMLAYNATRPLIFYTYQNYLKAAYSNLECDIDFARTHGVCFGAKLVRGAYINTERKLAGSRGYPDPVHATPGETTEMYSKSMDKMMDMIVKHPGKFATIIASHNEETTQRGLDRMEALGMTYDDGSVFFGQVFGMCEHVTAALGNCERGCLVFNALPYGSVEETLAYLSRRAVENKEALKGTRRDRRMMWQAVKDRITLF
ncbi:hypothetical protein ScPMuIL_005299 [Solemya velum]